MTKDLPRVAQTLDYSCGAACFDSMFKYLKGTSPGEMHFAKELQTLELGHTPPIHIVNLARCYGFSCEMLEDAEISDIAEGLLKDEVLFVTWWFEDAGHYSLVKQIDEEHILLMDPWFAREDLDQQLTIADFVPKWNQRGSKIIKVRAGAS
ncbi:MAG: cysteine peptidase family C39 domain-containing protein [Bdellovibrionota bacterium]